MAALRACIFLYLENLKGVLNTPTPFRARVNSAFGYFELELICFKFMFSLIKMRLKRCTFVGSQLQMPICKFHESFRMGVQKVLDTHSVFKR